MAQRLSLRNAALRFQDGGVVPGSGRGDKIPAKYEPGEFVVSNDMIADNPGLREQLSGLRAETLAARGRTVEEADAQALNGGRRPSLRAQAGFNGSADPDFWRGNPNPLQGNQANQTLLDAARQRTDPVQSAAAQAANAPPPRAVKGFDPLGRMAKDLTGQNPLPPRSPVGNMADDLARNARAAAPVPPPGPANPGMANPQAQAAYDEMARAKAPPTVEPAAPKPPGAGSKWFGSADDWKNLAKGPADSPHKTLRMTAPSAPTGLAKAGGAVQGLAGAYNAYEGLQEGDAWKAGVGTADAVAGAALFTPAAPVAGAYLGLRGAWDAGKAAGSALYSNLSEKAQDVVGGTLNQIGLNTGLWGEDDSAKLMADAQARLAKPADTPRTTAPGAAPDPRNPYADANAAKIAAADAQNKAAPAAPAAPPGYTNNVTRVGNEYSGTNVRGDISVNGRPPGGGAISAQNMAAADNLAASNDITPRLRAQAQYDAEVANAQRINDMQQRMNGAGSKAAMLDLRSPEYLAARNASVTSTISRDGRPRLRSEVEAETARTKMAQDAQIAQMQNQTTQRGQELNADASRYSSDNSLRGTMYSTDATLGAKRMEMERSLRQQQLMGGIYQAAGGDPAKAAKLAASYGLDGKSFQDMAAADQTRAMKNVEDARDTFKDLFTTPDGKIDKNAEANAHVMAAKIVPGWENMSAEQRAANRTKVVDAVKLVQGMNATKDTGWLQKIGLDSPNGAYSQLPELVSKDGKRAQVGEVGWWEGVTTPNVSRGDTVITLPNGTKRYLRGQLEESQAALLEQNGAQRQR